MANEPLSDADLELSDGRNLAYSIWGVADGRPMFLFHGSPGSRVFGPNPVATAEAGFRLITVDRPGYGRSDPQPGRQILDWPSDVTQLVDSLGLATFDVMGHSSGGPYALACAYAMPDRVDRVALVSCVAPRSEPDPFSDDVDDALDRLAWQDPGRAAEAIGRSAEFLVETPERFLELPRPEPDQRLLDDPDVRDLFLKTIRQAVQQGIDAYAWDGVLERRAWGFSLARIAAKVWIFHGEQDAAVPPSDAELLAAALPRSQVKLVADAGHGLIVASWAEILSALTR